MSQLTTNTATIDELITIANNLPDAGSGGEDVTDETTEYTNLLDDLEDAVNALPDAGSGGSSGGSMETCTVGIYTENSNYLAARFYTYMTLSESGEIMSNYVVNNTSKSIVLNNVVCGSIISLCPSSNILNDSYETNAECLFGTSGTYSAKFFAFKITAKANETASIYLRNASGGGAN